MSQETPVKITQRHYQALAGLSLGALFLLQLQHSGGLNEMAVIANLLVLIMGTISVLYRIRIPPILIPITLALPMLLEQYNLSQLNLEMRTLHSVDVGDVLLCVAILSYVVAMYRLQGLRFGLLPTDRRLSSESAARSEESLSASELLGLVVPIPAAAFFAQIALLLLRQRWSLYDLPPRWQQFILVAWVLLLVFFLGMNAFQYWRRLQMDRMTALLFLQDILWRETRSEQRTINRWIVWQKLRDRK